MAATSSSRRKCTSCPFLLLFAMNFFILLASAASLAVILFLKHPPTHLGYALIAASSVSFLSSVISFCSLRRTSCFFFTICMLLISMAGNGLGFLMLFSRESDSMRLLEANGSRERKFFVRVNAMLMLVMFFVQTVMLVVVCVLQRCTVAEYKDMEAQREEAAKRRNKKMAKVYEESSEKVKELEEMKAKELNEKMQMKYQQSVNNHDFED